jgi:predicted GH43/DUF377 family glycosyl hydrolase
LAAEVAAFAGLAGIDSEAALRRRGKVPAEATGEKPGVQAEVRNPVYGSPYIALEGKALLAGQGFSCVALDRKVRVQPPTFALDLSGERGEKGRQNGPAYPLQEAVMAASVLKRYSRQPVLEPRQDQWDKVSTFNPGAIWHEGKVHMLYRAVSDLGPYVSRFGLAVSEDGRKFRREAEAPVHGPVKDYEVGGIEDARITREGDDFLVTYAAVTVVPGPAYEEIDFFNRTKQDPYLKRPGIGPMGPSYTGLLRSKDLRRFEVEGILTPPDLDDRDGILFPEKIGGRYVLLHRPSDWTGKEYGTQKPGIWLAYSDDLKTWDYGQGDSHLLMKPQEGVGWEEAKIGGGPPPVKTPAGWLMLYHGVDDRYVYRVGAALLDLEDPSKVLARTREFLMEPVEEWEKVGVIPNVVFPTAAVSPDGSELLVYYGGADRVVGLAVGRIEEMLDYLLSL